MKKKKSPSRYLLIYKCESCGYESSCIENQRAICFYCDRTDNLVLVAQHKINPELIVARLNASLNNMMENLHKAYEQTPNLEPNVLGEGKDTEEEILKIMAQAKRLKDTIHKLKLKKKK